MKGTLDNLNAVGVYKIILENGDTFKLAMYGGKLVINGDGGYSQKAVALTLDDNGDVIATDQVLTGSKKEDQYWVATCTGDVEYDKEEKDHIKSASFKIESVSKTGFYLTASNNSICIGSTPTIWTLSMEPMKPQYLTFSDIVLHPSHQGNSFLPSLYQVGSLTNQKWSISPSLPTSWTFLPKTEGFHKKAKHLKNV